jgi:hypothetical protein
MGACVCGFSAGTSAWETPHLDGWSIEEDTALGPQ